MSRFRGVRRWFHLDRAVEEDIDEELAFHFARVTEELVAGGMTPEAARAEGLRRFGDVSAYRSELRAIDNSRRTEVRRTEFFALFLRHLSVAWRGVRRNPGFALIVAVTLGLGIGVNAVMFGVLDRILFRAPAHIQQPDNVRRVFVVRNPLGRMIYGQVMTWSDIADLKAAHGLSGVAAYHAATLALGRGEGVRMTPVNLVSPDFFPLLGTVPALGRFLVPADDSLAPGNAVAVISYGLWQRQFGGAPSVLGKVLDLGNGRYTVVGVAPRGFTGVDVAPVDVWLPLRPSAGESVSGDWERSRGFYWLRGVARLAPGASIEQVQAEGTALHLAGRSGDTRYSRQQAHLLFAPLLEARGPGRDDETRISLWAGGVSLAVLLVACANVANLLLFRAVRRRREIAIRLALGISRRQLIAELLTESLLLALLGGGGALLLAAWGSGLLHGLLQPDLAATLPALSPRIIGFTLLAALAAGTVAGLIPSWLESRPDLLSSLKQTAPGHAGQGGIRAGLVVLQAALSVVLLVGAGLFLRSFAQVRALDMGMEMSRVLVVTPAFAANTPEAEIATFFREAQDRVSGLPGVEMVAATNVVPHNWNWAEEFKVPGRDSIPTAATGGPYIDRVSTNYFGALGLRVLQGRGFGPEDQAGSARVTVLGQTMARLIWPDESPLGKCVLIGDSTTACTEVVGVVADTRRSGIRGEERSQYYVPLSQSPGSAPAALMVRADQPLALAAPVRQLITQLNPGLRYVETETLQDLYNPDFRSWSTGAALFSAFGGLALLVAAVGLYSLLSYGVVQRTREIGVRMALGARPAGVVGLVLQQGVILVLGGVVLGLAAAYLGAMKAAPLLFDTSPGEPMVYGAVALVLLIIATLAGAFPAWRASRVSPMTALRSE